MIRQSEHQSIDGNLYREISSYLKGKSCKSFIAPFGVWLDNASDDYVEPDITIICDPAKIHQKGYVGVPDMVLEVLSLSTAYKPSCEFIRLLEFLNIGLSILHINSSRSIYSKKTPFPLSITIMISSQTVFLNNAIFIYKRFLNDRLTDCIEFRAVKLTMVVEPCAGSAGVRGSNPLFSTTFIKVLGCRARCLRAFVVHAVR